MSSESVYIEESPLWMITYIMFTLFLLLWGFFLYLMIRSKRSNKRILNHTVAKMDNDVLLEKNEATIRKEKDLKRRKLIVKRKLGWMYAPDKLEKWLERMEGKGYNLHRVSKWGTTFYFSNGRPRNISYCLEYQNIANENAWKLHVDAGWEMVFATKSSLQKWMIWSKEYADDEEKPKIYTEKETKLMHARKIAITYSAIFTPLVLLYLYLVQNYFRNAFITGLDYLAIFNTFMFIVLIFIFSSYCLRSWLYYMRLKNA